MVRRVFPSASRGAHALRADSCAGAAAYVSAYVGAGPYCYANTLSMVVGFQMRF